jgi:RNA polymerase sigma-70 factor (ECF subfamily)
VAILNPTFMEERTFEAPSLLDQARAGDAEAFSEVCRVHESRLLRQAFSLCGEVHLAEDLAQETLVEAWKCLRRYNGRCLFFTWLCAILLNRYRNTLRERRSRPVSLLDEEGEEGQTRVSRLSDPNALPDEAIELREQALGVQRCIQMLSRKHQQVIYLRFYVDDSLESIAAALGCSVGTVKSRLFHALEKLRAMKALSRQCDSSKTVENV